jgi:hypothetical protein
MPGADRIAKHGRKAPAAFAQSARSCGQRVTAAAATPDRSRSPVPAVASEVSALISGYLDDLASALPGPGPARSAVVSEIGDGLLETVGSYRASGLPDDEAVRAAITDFGEPNVVAAAFRPEFALRRARRTALGLIASGPLVGAAWLAGAVAASLPPTRYQLSGLWWALPIVGLAIVVAAPSSVLAVLATGRLGLRLALPSSLPSRAASIASIAAVSADTLLFAILGLYALTTPAPRPLLPLAPAIVASLARVWLAARACPRLRWQ